MSTITKQWLQQKIAGMEATRDEIPFGLDEDDSNTLAAMKLALASLEAEPVEWRVAFRLDGQPGSDFEKTFENQAKMNEIISLHERAGFSASITPFYTAPPAPVPIHDEHYQHLSELYHTQEKRLFKIAQRITGPAFDKYAHSPSQAIDVLESAIFGVRDDTNCAAMQEMRPKDVREWLENASDGQREQFYRREWQGRVDEDWLGIIPHYGYGSAEHKQDKTNDQ